MEQLGMVPNTLPTSGWEDLERKLANAGKGPSVEAARKLITNRGRVLNDVCNPHRKTQPGIPVVKVEESGYVESGMKECAGRLLGQQARFPASFAERKAWVGMSTVIHARLQTSSQQCGGRDPDMSPAAGAALLGTLHGMVLLPVVSCGGCFEGLFPSTSSLPTGGWEDLEHKLAKAGNGPNAEAARKLITNRGRVLNDVCNSNRKTQKQITTVVSQKQSGYVENGMKECARRLLGEQARLPANAAERQAWASMATVISSRLQTSEGQCPGRAPDMSPGAGAALKSTLQYMTITQSVCAVQ